MKAQKVRDLDDNELRNQLRDMEEQLFRLQFQMYMGQTDGLKKLRGMRKDRAADADDSAASGNLAGAKK